MATIKQGILGGFSGSVAGVVGSSWKGIAVMKAKPLSVSNPRTAAQVAQRNKMAAAVAFMQVILSAVIKPNNDRFAGQMSGFNYVISPSIAAFDENGTLAYPANLRITRNQNHAQLIDARGRDLKTVACTFVSEEGSGFALATDKMYGVAYNETTGEIVTQTGSPLRGEEEVSFLFSENVGTDVIHTWICALRADGTLGFAQEYGLVPVV